VVPAQSLPDNANLEQLKKRAKSLQRLVLAGDPAAADVVKEFHPRLRSTVPGSGEFAGFTLSDAQLVIARQFGFPSWPKLKACVERAGIAEGASQPGAAMRVVAAALTARSERRFDQFGSMLAPEISWRGLPDQTGQITRCQGRAEALERMHPGLHRQVALSALVEEGDRVLARVHRVNDAEPKLSERFLVAEVHEGQITRLSVYFTESEAVDALRASSTGQLANNRARLLLSESDQ
jgi:hypothetical protein